MKKIHIDLKKYKSESSIIIDSVCINKKLRKFLIKNSGKKVKIKLYNDGKVIKKKLMIKQYIDNINIDALYFVLI